MKATPEALTLTASELALIQQLLKDHIPNTTVWAYGSRVNGNARPSSDLDLVAFVDPEQPLAIANLREAFEESNLPFRMDLFTWDQIPEAFRDTISARYVVVQNDHGRVKP